MDMLEHKVGKYFHTIAVRGPNQSMQFSFTTEASFHAVAIDRPVSMVAGILTKWFEVFLPRAFGVLIDRRKPKHVDSEVFKVALFKFFADTLKITAEVVCGRMHIGVVDWHAISRLGIVKTVGKSVINNIIAPEILSRLPCVSDSRQTDIASRIFSQYPDERASGYTF